MANRLQLEKDVSFHLVVVEEETPGRSAARLKAISDHLIQSGIDEERILTSQVEAIKKSNEGKIVIKLIE